MRATNSCADNTQSHAHDCQNAATAASAWFCVQCGICLSFRSARSVQSSPALGEACMSWSCPTYPMRFLILNIDGHSKRRATPQETTLSGRRLQRLIRDLVWHEPRGGTTHSPLRQAANIVTLDCITVCPLPCCRVPRIRSL